MCLWLKNILSFWAPPATFCFCFSPDPPCPPPYPKTICLGPLLPQTWRNICFIFRAHSFSLHWRSHRKKEREEGESPPSMNIIWRKGKSLKSFPQLFWDFFLTIKNLSDSYSKSQSCICFHCFLHLLLHTFLNSFQRWHMSLTHLETLRITWYTQVRSIWVIGSKVRLVWAFRSA